MLVRDLSYFVKVSADVKIFSPVWVLAEIFGPHRITEAHMGTPAKQNPILLRCRTDTTVKYLNVHNVVLYNIRVVQ